MSERDTGGFAFPLSVNTYDPEHPGGPRYTTELHRGMTLRDYFAAAFVASGHTPASERVAAQAYLFADAMLEARK
jgi:hypothetical protein